MWAKIAQENFRASRTLVRKLAGRVGPLLALPCCLWLGVGLTVAVAEVPFQESFAGTGPGEGWEQVIAPEGTIEVRRGGRRSSRRPVAARTSSGRRGRT